MKQRRYDLDWLRVISVFAVFLHHVFMPFNGDEFHIMNSEHSKLLDDIMVYFEQFRLPLLFLVSGVGTVFAFSKRSWKRFVFERNLRLLIPFVFGILILIPPQVYFENINDFTSFLEAYPEIVKKVKVHHLWFIGNLLLMSIFFIPLILFLKSKRSVGFRDLIEKYTVKFGMLFWVFALFSLFIISKHYFPSTSKSITNLSSTIYFSFYFVSGIIMTSCNNLWEVLYRNRKRNLTFTLIFSVLFYLYYFIPGKYVKPYFSLENRWRLWYLMCCLVSWSFVITSLGYSQLFLNVKSKLLEKFNKAVYPFYLLHQTVIICIGYYVLKLDLNIVMKILILFISSLIVIFLVYRFMVYPCLLYTSDAADD